MDTDKWILAAAHDQVTWRAVGIPCFYVWDRHCFLFVTAFAEAQIFSILSCIVVMWENWIVALFALRHWKLLFFFFADEFCRDFEVQPFHMNHLSYIYDAMSKWTTRNLFDVSIVRSQQRDLVAIRSRHPLHSHVMQFREGIICFCLL